MWVQLQHVDLMAGTFRKARGPKSNQVWRRMNTPEATVTWSVARRIPVVRSKYGMTVTP
jgi:hypothetical protein